MEWNKNNSKSLTKKGMAIDFFERSQFLMNKTFSSEKNYLRLFAMEFLTTNISCGWTYIMIMEKRVSITESEVNIII